MTDTQTQQLARRACLLIQLPSTHCLLYTRRARQVDALPKLGLLTVINKTWRHGWTTTK